MLNVIKKIIRVKVLIRYNYYFVKGEGYVDCVLVKLIVLCFKICILGINFILLGFGVFCIWMNIVFILFVGI